MWIINGRFRRVDAFHSVVVLLFGVLGTLFMVVVGQLAKEHCSLIDKDSATKL